MLPFLKIPSGRLSDSATAKIDALQAQNHDDRLEIKVATGVGVINKTRTNSLLCMADRPMGSRAVAAVAGEEVNHSKALTIPLHIRNSRHHIEWLRPWNRWATAQSILVV